MARILIVSKYYYPFQGGIEENVRLVAEAAALQHSVTVVASNHENGNSDEIINSVRVIRRHVHFNVKGQPVCLGLLSGIRLRDFDLVHFHSPNPLASAQFLIKRMMSATLPYVVTHHMDIFGRRILRYVSIPFLHWLVKGAHVTVVTSGKNLAISRDLPRSANYAVVPLAISQNDYVVDESLKQKARAWRKSISGEAPVIGFVGRHARYKGLVELVQAVGRLDGVHAYIGGDGPYREAAVNEATRLGISERVHFLGRLSHTEKLMLLAALDVFVFPSTEITEAFGISQMEAMLCGAPVVASDLPTGVTDVSIGGQTALLAPPSNVAILAEKIHTLLSDRELASDLSRAARLHVIENMTYSVVSAKMMAIFEDGLRTTAVSSKAKSL